MRQNRKHSAGLRHKHHTSDADHIDVRAFILDTPTVPVPQDAQEAREWILVNGFEFPVPVGVELEDALEASLVEKGFTEVRVNSQHEPAAVELSMTAPGPLSRRGVMGMMRVLARTVGYGVREGGLIVNVAGRHVEAAFGLEAVV